MEISSYRPNVGLIGNNMFFVSHTASMNISTQHYCMPVYMSEFRQRNTCAKMQLLLSMQNQVQNVQHMCSLSSAMR